MSVTAVEESRQSLTQREIDEFLQAEKAAGRSDSTIRRHRSDLCQLQKYLGLNPWLRPGSLKEWQNEMYHRGYAPRTIEARITTANRYLLYKGMPGLCQSPKHYAAKPEAILTPIEYRRLIGTAAGQGYHREELLMRVLAETGIPSQELPQVTVEAVNAGRVLVQIAHQYQIVPLPADLRRDLQALICQAGLHTGPVFVTCHGKPLARGNINLMLQKMARYAGLPPEKVTVRCLKKLSTLQMEAEPVSDHPQRILAETNSNPAQAVRVYYPVEELNKR